MRFESDPRTIDVFLTILNGSQRHITSLLFKIKSLKIEDGLVLANVSILENNFYWIN